MSEPVAEEPARQQYRKEGDIVCGDNPCGFRGART